MKSVSVVRQLPIAFVILVVLAIKLGEACNPTGNDPYRCWDICEADQSSSLCKAACKRWTTMKNCPAVKTDELRDDLPYSYPCVCFVNPNDDPIYDDFDNDIPIAQPINPVKNSPIATSRG